MALSDCEKCWDTPCTCGFHPHCNIKNHDTIEKALRLLVKCILFEGDPDAPSIGVGLEAAKAALTPIPEPLGK